ncbi:MAG TPA: DUF488 family protein [Ignavibacteriaceae bacterium]
MIKLKRVYDKYSDEDGFRILVDRLWPRGLTKKDAKIDIWLKEIAPSNELRKWYHQNSDEWTTFRKKYSNEIKNKKELLKQIKLLEKENGTISLVYAAKNLNKNNASALLSVLNPKTLNE